MNSLSELDSSLQGSASAAGLFASGGSGETGTELLTAYRHYERDSNDHFDTHLTRTFEPSLQSDGTVNYDHDAADDVFTSRFWESLLEESDTRSVQSTTQLSGWNGQYWLFGPVTVTKTDSYPHTDPNCQSAVQNRPVESGMIQRGMGIGIIV